MTELLAVLFLTLGLYFLYLFYLMSHITDEEYERARKSDNPWLEIRIILANKGID